MLTASILGACASQPAADQAAATGDSEPRHPALAAEHHARALKLIDAGELNRAEEALKKALRADQRLGPAHNNLGWVYFRQGRIYLSAWEFEYAGELMPKAPHPRNNLGLVWEKSGRLDDAVEQYAKAVELDPDNPVYIANLARAKLRRGDQDQDLRLLLSQIISSDQRPEWVSWAQMQMARLGTMDYDDPQANR